ncbi:PRA1 family protein F3 isoform X1 [Daucus carota subsp. sativus]|uniref:PRA1 family protein F3 isoform X1 n=1 Tax=Daucus carota subsp. sativus TaxID=79200 RepID=UPI0007EFBCD8|nr:PREDICTED: PRA1 family protein F3-like isoform X1 [Daucus carota subsp. sativus]XP_017235636.1 PREDICTED: PRA1 family protein F3-like isoform X1 [Daucus carota subsp. sativus]XP_017235637.1 PREDICTED: PRA1 family protein F3-like isoform X1 [Daucus carota subsp. sativus]XP_017235638.1 PREDICTED: PRA1 family protein F3-like isoform X1 [Daucus carota subsp. sativus]XP_017235639.1 PREDICTED: PRA1 family protein F3-like isoform X1 [Daucus carota subsp. sativus]XP_017235640.1 PREDICTED: PRA1 fami
MTNYGTIPTASSEGTNESISTATQQVSGGIRNGRPWKEMVRSLNLPSGFGDTSDRIKTNLVYFRTNYIAIFMLIIFLSFWIHHFSNTVFLAILIDLILVLYFSNSKLIIILVMISVILLLFTEAAWNIISSLLIEAVVVTAHAIFRKTDDLSLDEESAPAAGIPNARPWKEMLRSLNFPSGFRNTIERMKTNINYFEINYVVILMLILCLSFLWHPISLDLYLNLYTDILFFIYYLYREPSSVLHGSLRKIIIVFIMIGVIALSEAAWINVISTLLIEALVVAVHASFRKTDDLFLALDEELAQTSAALTVSSA